MMQAHETCVYSHGLGLMTSGLFVLRNLAIYGYQIPEKPEQLLTRSVGDSIRSLSLDITCSASDLAGTGSSCGDLAR